jgi:membrane associated rhomboid family serine protease
MGGNDPSWPLWLVKVQTDLEVLGWFFLVICLLHLSNWLIWKHQLNHHYGIRPRRDFSLLRFTLSPYLHGDRQHLIANSVPLLSLAWMVMQPDRNAFWVVTAVIMVVGGLGTWLFGAPNTIHVGTSGLFMGYFGFLLSRGIFERNGVMIAVASIIMILFRALIPQIVPNHPQVSATGHFFGFVGGIVAAWVWVEVGG